MQPDLLQLLQEEEDADRAVKSQRSHDYRLRVAPHQPTTPPSFPPPLEYQMDGTGAVHLIRSGSQTARDFTVGVSTSLDAGDWGRRRIERGSGGADRLQAFAPDPLPPFPSKLTTSARRVFMRPHTAQMTNTVRALFIVSEFLGAT